MSALGSLVRQSTRNSRRMWKYFSNQAHFSLNVSYFLSFLSQSRGFAECGKFYAELLFDIYAPTFSSLGHRRHEFLVFFKERLVQISDFREDIYSV
ncbi:MULTISPECIES: hypothetical protein [Agrobacterium]|nr:MULTISPECIES: hypothetical protein [Agrobacterium]NSL21053.1 hypothetical protein [Agrobacterium tumefaciens]NSZ00707.1 hypothetical protein [Agrobacterium tumefaciens]NSZ09914.1 hypothetical protein [Agrobacterium tumefaciens]NSZ39630.1 hypothetical protein [Agrobacterium tumefaciens]NTB05604.1 hypothetical protein [Agrobacterium tumefaciens]